MTWSYFQQRLGVPSVVEKVRMARRRWYGRVVRKRRSNWPGRTLAVRWWTDKVGEHMRSVAHSPEYGRNGSRPTRQRKRETEKPWNLLIQMRKWMWNDIEQYYHRRDVLNRSEGTFVWGEGRGVHSKRVKYSNKKTGKRVVKRMKCVLLTDNAWVVTYYM